MFPTLQRLSVRQVSAALLIGSSIALSAIVQSAGSDPAIAFVESGLKVMNADGTNVKTVMTLKSGEVMSKPVWSPSGTQFAFAGKIGGVAGIYTINLDGTGRKLVTTLREPNATLISITPIDWSRQPGPDGKYKLLYRDQFPNPGPIMPGFLAWDIMLVNLDGTGKVNVTSTPVRGESECTFTRSGSEFVTWGPGPLGSGYIEARKHSLGLDGAGNVVSLSSIQLFTQSDVPIRSTPYAIKWANLSDTFTCFLSTPYRSVYWADPSSTPPAWSLVTGGVAGQDDFHPSPSPDDTKVCFQRVGTGAGIYVINRDGTNPVKIRTTGNYPVWKRPASGP